VCRTRTDPWGLRVSPRNFAEQMLVLREAANAVSLERLHTMLDAEAVPPRTVVVTFDDGYVDNLIHARPALERSGVPATVFVATGRIGSSDEFWWDELDRLLLQPGRLPAQLSMHLNGSRHVWQLDQFSRLDYFTAHRTRNWRGWHEPPPTTRHAAFRALWQLLHDGTVEQCAEAIENLRRWAGAPRRGRETHRCVTLDELRELGRSDLIEIGGHTVSHPSLASIDVTSQQREIDSCRDTLEAALQKPITSFSYPFGTQRDYTQQTIDLLKQSGFARACSNFPGPISAATDRFQLPRRVVMDWDGREFADRLGRWLST
jgi:peptidoglycan/xylan/chitin deacetylase (PgdA/CDA1 family)